MPRLLIVGGSDAGISAALRARELDPASEVTVLGADAYPYTPPLGSPWDVLQVAAQAWAKRRRAGASGGERAADLEAGAEAAARLDRPAG